MTRLFVFHGVYPFDKADSPTVFLKEAENVDDASRKLLESYEDWRYPEKVVHYGVAYESEHIPDHLNLAKAKKNEWNRTFHEVNRLIKTGAVPFSYMLIEDRWYRADQSLLTQGLTNGHVNEIMEEVRVLRGAIVMEHDEKRFRNVTLTAVAPEKAPPKILTGVTEGMEPVHIPEYFRVPRDSEGTPIPNPGEEMEQLVSSFLQSVGAEPKTDHMQAVRDIAKRFS